MDTAVGNMQDEAVKRRERLKALKSRKGGDATGPPEKIAAPSDEKGSLPKPIFRSYKPTNPDLKESALPTVEPIKVEEHVKEQLEAAKPEPAAEEVDLVKLAPRKPDWDLKRDIAKKLEKLDKRTQRAIAELIRERLKSGKDDLASVVSSAFEKTEDSDDED